MGLSDSIQTKIATDKQNIRRSNGIIQMRSNTEDPRSKMHVCMHVCMHICTYIDIYIYIHDYICVYIYVDIYAYVHTYMHTYMHLGSWIFCVGSYQSQGCRYICCKYWIFSSTHLISRIVLALDPLLLQPSGSIQV